MINPLRNNLLKVKLKYTNKTILFFQDRFMGVELAQTGCYEEPIINWIVNNFFIEDDRNIVLDIGANIGVYSLVISGLCCDAKILAFEPHPSIFNVLVYNTMSSNNIMCYNYAISDKNTVGTFYCDPLNTGYNYICDERYRQKEEEKKQIHIRVPVRELDWFGIDFSKVSLIKIDIEKFHGDIMEYFSKKILPGTIVIVENNDVPTETLKDYDVNREIGKDCDTLVCVKKIALKK